MHKKSSENFGWKIIVLLQLIDECKIRNVSTCCLVSSSDDRCAMSVNRDCHLDWFERHLD